MAGGAGAGPAAFRRDRQAGIAQDLQHLATCADIFLAIVSTDDQSRAVTDAVSRYAAKNSLIAVVATNSPVTRRCVAALTTTGWTTQHVLRSYLVGQVNGRLISSERQVQQYTQQQYGNGGVPRFPTDYVVFFTLDGGQPQVQTPPMGPGATSTSENQPALPTFTYAQAKKHGPKPFTIGSTRGDDTWQVVVLPALLSSDGGITGQPGSVALAQANCVERRLPTWTGPLASSL